MPDNSKRGDANAQVRKEQRADEGRKAMAEYEAEVAATRAKTERLRAMRLAREAEQAKNPPVKATKTKSAGGKKKAAAKPGKSTTTLAEWLKNRQEDGF